MEEEERDVSPEQEMEIRKEQMKEDTRKEDVPVKKTTKGEDIVEPQLFGVIESKPRHHDLDYDAMIRKSIDIPGERRALESKMAALINKQNLIEISLKRIQNRTYQEVFDDKFGTQVEVKVDKKGWTKEEKEAYEPKFTTEYKPKYTNEKSREIEVDQRLTNDEECIQLNEDKYTTLDNINKTKSEDNELRRMMRMMENVIELMKLKLRMI